MQRNFTIEMSNPCSQSWEAMSPAKNGRHCAHCNAQVVDFTAMDLAQLQHYFHTTHQVCGRISIAQLDQFNQQKLQQKHPKLIGLKIAFASTLALLAATKVSAQQLVKNTGIVDTPKAIKSPLLSSNGDKVQMLLRGKVMDGDTFLADTTVKVNGLAQTTKTDTAGRFSLLIKGRTKDYVRVSFSHLGYQTQQIELILTAQGQQINVNMEPDELALGELVIVGPKNPEKQTTIVGGLTVTLRKRPSFFRRVVKAIGSFFSNNHHQ